MKRHYAYAQSLSRVRLSVTPWTAAYQAPPSMGFSRQECWSGLPFPSPEDLPDPGTEPGSPALQADALPSEPPGKPKFSFFSLVAVDGVYSLRVVHWLPIAMASLVVTHRLQSAGSGVVPHQLTCRAACGLLVPRPGIEPMAPVLAGRFLTTEPPGKSLLNIS